MGDLAADAALVAVDDGVWQARVSREWEIWGPNGGHVASLALGAAQASSGRARPANATVHFLAGARFDEPLTLTATTQRATRQATSTAVHAHQGDRPILAAMVWSIDEGLDGLAHDDLPLPAGTPHWRDLPNVDERFAADGVAPNRHPFWRNFDERPTTWISDWPSRTLAPARWDTWIRFTEGGPQHDPWLQAARLLLLVDLGAWPSVGRRHVTDGWVAPSIDVSCEFHHLDTADEWFLLHGESPVATGGLVASHQQVWGDGGHLLASGISHLLCRRVDLG